MALSIQERLKDLRVERKLTLEQLAKEVGLSSSALGSYENDEGKDISHYALVSWRIFTKSLRTICWRGQKQNATQQIHNLNA